jgi:hypothetical protein
MLIKTVIGLLAAVALVILYQGMRHEQATVDPGAPLNSNKILAVLHMKHLACDNVTSYTPLGLSADGKVDGYLARCADGGRYVYFQNATLYGAVSCKDVAYHFGYYCPE